MYTNGNFERRSAPITPGTGEVGAVADDRELSIAVCILSFLKIVSFRVRIQCPHTDRCYLLLTTCH